MTREAGSCPSRNMKKDITGGGCHRLTQLEPVVYIYGSLPNELEFLNQ
ncbi:hypothetical protein D3OALGA1CA_5650 [Olavius algarvensis associated proteobacterium Delta 3]|nr:hypothetical protein D3OALGB2SA_4426 [Olavius algarvensis associated proteobacterium Delta 3]CAB5169536.1 hypothetical protein D3OALGA1CA_5650 [Olavius algarvensis associated proteobacterium Delta 3]